MCRMHHREKKYRDAEDALKNDTTTGRHAGKMKAQFVRVRSRKTPS
jgi:hypothetical protein